MPGSVQLDLLAVSLVSALLLAIAAITRPPRAACPAGYDLRTGIRRDGRFECWPAVVGDPAWDGTWGRPERGRQPPGIVAARIYCRAPAVPIVLVGGRAVRCQHL